MTSNIYAICKQIHPPTAVEHCLYCYFYNSHEQNLLVAGASYLRVFKLTPEVESYDKVSSTPPKLKLECLQTFSLFGIIISMKSVRFTGATRDALLLSFRDAKLSVVEYDPATHDLKTLSLHYFEEDAMKAGFTHHYHLPFVAVDPDGRCAAMIIYGRTIVILPFRRETNADEQENNISIGSKSPVLASYSIKLTDIDEKMNNVIDIQFLHGYYEPTLLLLYEPLRTWPGRVAVRRDTFAIIALSLNIHQKVHPVIWSLSSLPFDCLQAIPVPKPLGGVLIFAVNSILYLNQSVPPYGVALNSFTESSTAFPLKHQDNVRITLDCAQACFFSYDKLVISLKGGELYVVTLFNDGMRSVRSFNFDKAAASVLTTCMTLCEEGYLFLGSRLGNSLLLRYTEKIQDNFMEEVKHMKSEHEERPVKKKRLDNMDDWMASDVALIEDPEELEVYGSEMQTTKQITSYTFEVCDSLLNIGPCGRICMGEPAFQSEEFSNNADPDLELVSTAGYGKNGAICVLQRSIRPQVVTTFELPGCVDMWTVFGPSMDKKEQEYFLEDLKSEEGDKYKKDDSISTHAFLILSRMDSSMILQTGQEINELDHSGFSTQASTIFAGNLGDNKYILQVSPMGVRLLSGCRQLQHIPLDVGSPIVWSSVCDPYALIMSEEGLVIQLTLRQDPSGTNSPLVASRPQLAAIKSKILTLCVYKDVSGLFTVSPREVIEAEPPPSTSVNNNITLTSTLTLPKSDMDDEDALLYGEPTTCAENEISKIVDIKPKKKVIERKETKPTYWLFIVRENGVLEIYSLPNYKLSFLVKNFPMGQKLLVDSIQITAMSATNSGEKQYEKQHDSLPIVQEILVIGLGPSHSRPLLMARIDEELVMYEAFPFYENQTDNHLKLRFRKVNHDMILRERKERKIKNQEAREQERFRSHQRWLRPFRDISGYSGVFICGPYPHWLFMTSHGELRVHQMGIDGSITCFAPFHNVNCPKGFLYFNKQGELRICVLPTHLSYDSAWPVRKVPLRSTPHFVNYHPETKTYCIVTSTMEQCTRLVRFNGDEKEFEELERDERFLYPYIEKFTIQLFSPVSWETIPNTRIELEEWEHVTCVKNVMLMSEGTRSGLKGYLAIGTNYNYGEDVTSRGRILILDIIDVVPEPGQPLTKNKIKVLYSKEQKGPVTAISQVVGFLLSAIGQKVYIWQLKDNDLVGIAFIDTQIYIHSAMCIKNLILVADIFKSISLLRYQEESRTLSLVSKDVKPLEVYATEFLVDNNQVGFVVSDVEKNIVVFMYQPEGRESCGGQRLLRKGDFHLGNHINSFFRIRCKLGEVSSDKRLLGILEKRHITMFATLDGSLGYLMPVSEKSYRRLLMLQNVLVTHIPHTCGLNPKAFRALHSQRKYLMNPHKSILDGDLLWKYLNLSVMEKCELAKKIGTTADQVMEDLSEIDKYTSHF